MFEQMINGSRAVLLRPSVASFEEHERNDLGWALIYIVIGTVVAGVLGVLRALINVAATQQLQQQLQQSFGGRPLPPVFGLLIGATSIGGALVGIVVGIVFLLIWLGIIYLLARAFGGTGQFGELAYDYALFSAPLAVISSLINLIGIGPLVYVTGLISLVLFGYQLYLTWLSVQAGMNLPGGKAFWTIAIPFLVGLLLCCGFAVLVGGLIANSIQQTR